MIVTLSIVAIPGLGLGLLGARAYAACSMQEPTITACLITIAQCTPGGSCVGSFGQTTANGLYGCATSANKTDCVDGLANQVAFCYTQCGCIAVGQNCVMGTLCQNFNKVFKVAKDCPPGT
jgi:hypothetical protein